MVKEAHLWNAYATNNAISANGSHLTLKYTVESDEALELVGLGVVPDYAAGVSNLDYLDIEVNGKKAIGPLLCNHLGLNMMPAILRAHKRPLFTLGPAMVRETVTLKLKSRDILGLRFYAGATAVSQPYHVYPFGVRYEGDAIMRRLFGVDCAHFDTISGGMAQARPTKELLLLVLRNKAATTPNKWYDMEEKLTDESEFTVEDYEFVEIERIGVKPFTNLQDFQLMIAGKTWPRDYPFRVAPTLNQLPFGDDDDYKGPYKPPEPLRPAISKQKFKVQVRDNGTAVSATEAWAYLMGTKIST